MLLMSPLFCLLSGAVLGYLRGFQQKYFGLRKNCFLFVILIGTSFYCYYTDQLLADIALCVMIASNFIALVLGMVLGGLVGQRTGRLSSWIFR